MRNSLKNADLRGTISIMIQWILTTVARLSSAVLAKLARWTTFYYGPRYEINTFMSREMFVFENLRTCYDYQTTLAELTLSASLCARLGNLKLGSRRVIRDSDYPYRRCSTNPILTTRSCGGNR